MSNQRSNLTGRSRNDDVDSRDFDAPSRRKGREMGNHVVNVRLLVITCAVGAVLAVVGGLWYKYRVNQLADAFLQRANALLDQEHWTSAASYLQRYLSMKPSDVEARLKWVDALGHFATTVGQKRQLVTMRYEVVGLLPTRTDLRLKLAEDLLDTDNFQAVETEGNKLLSSPKIEEQRAARRLIAISQQARARVGGSVTFRQAAAASAQVLNDDPGDVKVAAGLAEMYRSNAMEFGVEDAAAKADSIMDRLVAAKPKDPEALLARFKYRQQYKPDIARLDLDTILEEHPDHVDALYCSALEEYRIKGTAARDEMEKKLKRMIAAAPRDARGYHALAGLYATIQKRDLALEVLMQGKKAVVPLNLDLDRALTAQLVEAGRIDEAETILGGVQREYRKLIPELEKPERISNDNSNRLLIAKILMAKGKHELAVRELNAVITSSDERGVLESSNSARFQALGLLAIAMTKLQRMDQAAVYWKIVADDSPKNLSAKLQSGKTFLGLGRPSEAITQLDECVASQEAPDEAWIALVQAHLQQQVRLSPAERNWGEFTRRLTGARKKTTLAGNWELELAELSSLLLQDKGIEKDKLVARLRDLEPKLPATSEAWRRVVFYYHQLGTAADEERALVEFDKREPDESQRIFLRASLCVASGQLKEALQLNSEAINKAKPENRRELQLGQIQLQVALRDLDGASATVAELIKASPKDPRLLNAGVELALERKDSDSAQRWLGELKNVLGDDSAEVRYLQARSMIGQYETLRPESRSTLERLVESLRSARPNWYPAVALAGQLAEQKRDAAAAIDCYQRAVELGDLQTTTWSRLIFLLYATGRLDDANKYTARSHSDLPITSQLESLSIAMTLRQKGQDEALKLAEQAIDHHPKDPVYYIWKANLLLSGGKPAEADSAFGDLIKRFPKDGLAWNGYFTYLISSQRKDEAGKALDNWIANVELDETSKHSIRAQGTELLGDLNVAQQEYRAVIALQPSNIQARLRLGKLLLSVDSDGARTQFEEVRRIDPKNSEARQFLARLLANSGESSDWAQAVELLKQQGGAADAAGDDDRLRAILLARRGRNRDEREQNCQEARQILKDRLDRVSGTESAAVEMDRLLLANIYEQEASLGENPSLLGLARETFQPLVSRPEPPREYLITYIRFLLRHAANKALADGEMRKSFLDDANRRISELNASIGNDPKEPNRILPVSLRASLLTIQGKDAEARKVLEDFGTKSMEAVPANGKSTLCLQMGNSYSTIGELSQTQKKLFYAEAEKWYRQLTAADSNGYVMVVRSMQQQDRIDDALAVAVRGYELNQTPVRATVISQVLASAQSTSERTKQATMVVNSAFEKFPDNTDLQLSMAVQQLTNGFADDAIRTYKRVLEKKPQHTMALNNLATLLAEQPEDGAKEEARKYIDQAIASAGREPALLDTLGTILIYTKQYELAAAALEEATAGAETDPRYHFHLAVAYQRSGRQADARKRLAEARRRGLDGTILTQGDRQMLAGVEHDLLTSTREE